MTEATNNQNTQVIQGIVADQLLADLLRERRSERRWKWIKRILFTVISGFVATASMIIYMDKQGFKMIPNDDIVGVVRIEGTIDRGSLASADKVIPILKKAFEAKNVRAIILQINSPGGAPEEAERINRAIAVFRTKNPKPVVATIDNVGASAAYMIAIHADKIYAGNYSLVGSIGAILSAWDLHRVKEKLQVEQRVFASGALKDMLNPFHPVSPAQEMKAKSLVDNIAAQFIADVRQRRGNRLKTEHPDLFSGTVWTGAEALNIGLIDHIGTVETVANAWKMRIYDFGPIESESFKLPGMISSVLVDALRGSLSQGALDNGYQLR